MLQKRAPAQSEPFREVSPKIKIRLAREMGYQDPGDPKEIDHREHHPSDAPEPQGLSF